MLGLKPALAVSLLGLLGTSSGLSTAKGNTTSYCIPKVSTTLQQEQAFTNFLHYFYIARNVPKAFKLYVAEDFIQHNPYEQSGAANSQAYLTNLFGNMTYGVEVLRVGFDSGLGFIHTKLTNYEPVPIAIADIFRFNGSCIQEHWDVIQALPADATNPIALF